MRSPEGVSLRDETNNPAISTNTAWNARSMDFQAFLLVEIDIKLDRFLVIYSYKNIWFPSMNLSSYGKFWYLTGAYRFNISQDAINNIFVFRT